MNSPDGQASRVESSRDRGSPSGKDPEQQLQDTMGEIAILQSYARSVGKQIPEKALDNLQKLADFTVHARTHERAASVGETLRLALALHGQLSEVATPATVRSLKATDPDQTLWSWVKHIWVVPLIFVMTVLAFVVLVVVESKVSLKREAANGREIGGAAETRLPNSDTPVEGTPRIR